MGKQPAVEIENACTDAARADVSGDGSHFQVIAVGEIFDGMSRVKKQQAVYAPLMEYIADNRIHALSIKAFTPQEWARDRKLNGF
jgi:acid stress-induced BolA-like protein IbaG/YrbA